MNTDAEFREANLRTPLPFGSYLSNPRTQRWRPPNPNELIMNTDAAVRPHDNFAGIGVCIRDHYLGRVIACRLKRINGKLSPESAEILVVREGLLFAQHMNLSISVIETDASRVVQSMLHPQPLADTALVFTDIFHLMSIVNYGTSRYIPREGNEVAH
ncbi:Ribonuclease H-like domain containing protein [Trema orientale]|uniref:Ribonuclease H-like domain containing protein n=1 Tax=Trema orientale TaxID=63057 RepID=A0A2P5FTV7_TREOI|nr:Ribonuclease H-like domain containing protein [Trema orientale]